MGWGWGIESVYTNMIPTFVGIGAWRISAFTTPRTRFITQLMS